ncbi:hypothetical protein [Nocardioides xinjiangensis]|uniref:hypothetical protein n=1 Tax=Nocardioides xinjiangensis TaxID=2817376 RepID=UPI001B3056DE|nr:MULTISPECIES: hypothetical protein [unclassified Nocardioides]
MSNDLDVSVLTVLAVLAGIAVLLYVMAALDPTNVRKPKPAHRAAARGRAES